MGIDSLSCQGWHKASLPFQQVKTQLLRCTLAQLVKLLFQWVGLRVSIRSWTQRYLNSGCKSADDADAQFGYVRTLDREAGVMGKWTHLGPQLWEKEGKTMWLPPCMSLPQQHPAAQLPSVLASPCSHPPPAVGVSTAHPLHRDRTAPSCALCWKTLSKSRLKSLC